MPRRTYRRPAKPTEYRSEFCDLIIDAGIKGKTLKEFASSIDVHYSTLNNWAERHPDFKEAKQRSLQECENFYMKIGRTYGLYGRKTDKNGNVVVPFFNTTVWIFILKCRFGWRENDPVVNEEDLDVEFVD